MFRRHYHDTVSLDGGDCRGGIIPPQNRYIFSTQTQCTVWRVKLLHESYTEYISSSIPRIELILERMKDERKVYNIRCTYS